MSHLMPRRKMMLAKCCQTGRLTQAIAFAAVTTATFFPISKAQAIECGKDVEGAVCYDDDGSWVPVGSTHSSGCAIATCTSKLVQSCSEGSIWGCLSFWDVWYARWECTYRPAGFTCRPSEGLCDAPETCTGNQTFCPPQTYYGADHECRAEAGGCDVADHCDGSGKDCPVDVVKATGTECRGVPAGEAGACDVAESCDGTSNQCPTDAFKGNDVQCRGAGGVCDAPESCSGTGAACPTDVKLPATQECRASGGVCDAAELCDGQSNSCPGDAKKATTFECRPAAGDCDQPDFCDGSMNNGCPGDTKKPATVECRHSDDVCDATEFCDGGSSACPEDRFARRGDTCNDGDACTSSDICNGLGTCEGEAKDCSNYDREPCGIGLCSEGRCYTGESPTSPADTLCDDGVACTTGDKCDGAQCQGDSADCKACTSKADCNDTNPCTEDTCDSHGRCIQAEISGCCQSDEDCPGDQNSCVTFSCNQTSHTCVATPIENCCEEDSDCETGNACTTSGQCDEGTGTCQLVTDGDCCTTNADCNDENACTDDLCSADGVCHHVARSECCIAASDCDDGNQCTEDVCGTNGCEHTPAPRCTAPKPKKRGCAATDTEVGGWVLVAMVLVGLMASKQKKPSAQVSI